MTAITAAMVKELRESTGAGMMDCKAALTESGGEMEAAQDWLRKKGLSKAAKKAGRVAAEGLIGAVTSGNKGVVVEVNSETDFVARNEQFQGLVKMIAQVALKVGADVDKINAAPVGNATVAAAIWRAPLAGLGGTSGSKVAVPDKKAPESGDAQQCGEVAGAYLSRNIRARKNVRPLWVAEVSTTREKPVRCGRPVVLLRNLSRRRYRSLRPVDSRPLVLVRSLAFFKIECDESQ